MGTLTLIKILLFVFLALFCLTGVVCIALGSIGIRKHYTIFIDNLIAVPIVMIILGIIIVIVSITGVVGVITRRNKLLTIFGYVLFGLCVALIVVVILIYVYRHKLSDYKDSMATYMEESLSRLNEKDQAVWDDLQTNLMCCGVQSPEDWTKSINKIPLSCCPDDPDVCTVGLTYSEGCHQKLFEKLDESSLILGGLGIGLAVIGIMTALISCTMAKTT